MNDEWSARCVATEYFYLQIEMGVHSSESIAEMSKWHSMNNILVLVVSRLLIQLFFFSLSFSIYHLAIIIIIISFLRFFVHFP